MTISELIRELEKIKSTHGDIGVRVGYRSGRKKEYLPNDQFLRLVICGGSYRNEQFKVLEL